MTWSHVVQGIILYIYISWFPKESAILTYQRNRGAIQMYSIKESLSLKFLMEKYEVVKM